MCRFATAYEGKYSDSINQAFVYPSSNFLDDIAWGAAWLYQRTGEQQFLTVSPLNTLKLFLKKPNNNFKYVVPPCKTASHHTSRLSSTEASPLHHKPSQHPFIITQAYASVQKPPQGPS